MTRQTAWDPGLVDFEDEETGLTNVIDFKEARKGFDGGSTTNEWLSGIKDRSIILVQNANNVNDFTLGEFQKMLTDEKTGATLLYTDLNNEMFSWVEPKRFCRQWRLYAILRDGPEEETPQAEPEVAFGGDTEDGTKE